MKLPCGLILAHHGCFRSKRGWWCLCTGSVPLTEGEMQVERQRRAARKACDGSRLLDGGLPESSAALELFEAA